MDNNRIFNLYLLIVFLNFLDIYTTVISIRIGLFEANLAATWLWGMSMFALTIIVKVAIVIAFGAWIFLSLHFAGRNAKDYTASERAKVSANKRVAYALGIVVLYYLFTVCNNIFWIVVNFRVL